MAVFEVATPVPVSLWTKENVLALISYVFLLSHNSATVFSSELCFYQYQVTNTFLNMDDRFHPLRVTERVERKDQSTLRVLGVFHGQMR